MKKKIKSLLQKHTKHGLFTTLKDTHNHLENNGLKSFQIIEDYKNNSIVILILDDKQQTLTNSEIIEIVKKMKYFHISVVCGVYLAFSHNIVVQSDDIIRFSKL
jgi:hypothetical protein